MAATPTAQVSLGQRANFQFHRSTYDYPAYHNMPGKDRGAVVAIKKLGA